MPMVSYGLSGASYTFSDHIMLPLKGCATPPNFRADRPYVLVVDDTYDILSVIMMLLEDEGLAGLGMVDSRQVPRFLDEIQAENATYPSSRLRLPSLILLDFMMPGLSGDELAAWLSQHPCYQHIPLMMMTAHPSIQRLAALPGI